MTKKQQKRLESLLPDGKPKWVRCYDNGGRSFDRYTVVYTGTYTRRTGGLHGYVGMSSNPFHPQGFGQHGESDNSIDAPLGWAPAIGRKCHLGTRIPFEDLPEDCQKLVTNDYLDLWGLET